MGRRKTIHPHLPPNVVRQKSRYYFNDGFKRIPLGNDLEKALRTAERYRATRTTGDYRLLSAVAIVANAKPLSPVCGIYFLVLAGEVVYVGQSLDIEDRVREHKTAGKVFDAYHAVACHPEDMRGLEAAYIATLCPRLNAHKPSLRSRIRSGTVSLMT